MDLKDRVVATLTFFSLQDLPLTTMELHRFLLADATAMRPRLDADFELSGEAPVEPAVPVSSVLAAADGARAAGLAEESKGFWYLPGNADSVERRLSGYRFQLPRERRIRRYLWFLSYLPFVRAAAVGGSQALGQAKPESDIDLLVFTAPGRIWMARTFVSLYFQVLGMRRHGELTKNRFCLNHYLAAPKAVTRERNLYKAMEYLRLRPRIGHQAVAEFQRQNLPWIRAFFPNAAAENYREAERPAAQRALEALFGGRFGSWLERALGSWQQKRIRQDRFTFCERDELSFHPGSRHLDLLGKFFQKTGA